MKALIGAVLGEAARRLLLLDAPLALGELARRPATSLVVVVSPRRRLLRQWQGGRAAPPAKPPVALVVAKPDTLPFARPGFDAVVAAEGAAPAPEAEPVAALRALRRLLRTGGALLVASRLREGDVGVAASLARQVAARGRGLPRAEDLAAWMLAAGLRSVRQARVRRVVVPTVVTWGEARPRPWEDSYAASASASAPAPAPPVEGEGDLDDESSES